MRAVCDTCRAGCYLDRPCTCPTGCDRHPSWNVPVEVKAHGSGSWVDLEEDGGVHHSVQAEVDGRVVSVELSLGLLVGLARYARSADPVGWAREELAQAEAEAADAAYE